MIMLTSTWALANPLEPVPEVPTENCDRFPWCRCAYGPCVRDRDEEKRAFREWANRAHARRELTDEDMGTIAELEDRSA